MNDNELLRRVEKHTEPIPDTLIATVREAIEDWEHDYGFPHETPQDAAACNRCQRIAALDSLAAELERLRHELQQERVRANNWELIATDQEAELERVKAERDNWHASNHAERQARLRAEARLDKALTALRRELGYTHGADTIDRLRAAIAEIEGEA